MLPMTKFSDPTTPFAPSTNWQRIWEHVTRMLPVGQIKFVLSVRGSESGGRFGLWLQYTSLACQFAERGSLAAYL